MNKSNFEIIDFHTHHVPADWHLTTTVGRHGDALKQWQQTNILLADFDALLEGIDSGDISGRVVNIPTALIADSNGMVPPGTEKLINDRLAELVARRPNALMGLASIDGFGGDVAALELVRAVNDLGFHGAFVDCARGDLLLDSPQSRPVLTAAAELGIPLFVHPVDSPLLTRQMSAHGRIGTFLARGTINAASLISLIEGGILQSLPTLNVVVTTLAIGGLMLEGGFSSFSKQRDVIDVMRRQVYIDTMGFHPALIKASVDLLGSENVMVGSDWPIVNAAPISQRVKSALAASGLDQNQQRLVAAGNARRLLKKL